MENRIFDSISIFVVNKNRNRETKCKIESLDDYSSGSIKNHLKDKRVKYVSGNTRDINDIYEYAQYFIIEGSLSPHVDKRTAAFTIPLRGVDTPVVWYDENDNVLDSYLYEGPTLIDTNTKHGAEENLYQRLHFQIGGFTEPFSKIVENL